MKVEVILSSVEKNSEYVSNDLFKPNNIYDNMRVISGRAAGICYAPDNYFSKGIYNTEKARIRAGNNSISGHYSVFEHGHISFLIETSKAMAMILNSTRLYSTSEKSARYTNMKLSVDEKIVYDKWIVIFSNLIKLYDTTKLDDKSISKLAMENARYLTSIFTPTIMEYTVPYSRAILLCQWLDDLAYKYIDNINDKSTKIYNIYYKRISEECKELARLIRESIGEKEMYPSLIDHKNMGITFYDNIPCDKYNCRKYESFYGDVYISKYEASLAAVAQMQRHRTLTTSIDIIDKLVPYIPKIIRNTPYEKEWIDDYNRLLDANILPQATKVSATERGLFEDFVLKCKDRLCARTQLETASIVEYQVLGFYLNNIDNVSTNLNNYNEEIIKDMVYIDSDNSYKRTVKTRCRFKDFKCREVCDRIKSNQYRIF
jgi:hypothetical protein